MRLGNFTLQIVGGRELGNGQVELSHGQTYKIRMRNHFPRRADCELTVDGEQVGCFRLSAHQTMTIDRPADKARLLTFFKLGTAEAAQGGIVDDENVGLVTAVFYPEIERQPIYRGELVSKGIPMASAASGPSLSAGGTALTGRSNQQFTNVGGIVRDYAHRTTIHLRLVCRDDVPAIEPLGSKVAMSTAVPPRV